MVEYEEFLVDDYELKKVFEKDVKVRFSGYGGNYYVIKVNKKYKTAIEKLKKWYPYKKTINYF